MIIGSMATFPKRADLFWNSARRIASQVDILHITLNEFESVPNILDLPENVHFTIPNQDLKDVGKFLTKIGDDDTVFFVDDDILYPQDYVSKSLAEIKAIPVSSPAVFGYHGTRYLPAEFRGDFESAVGVVKHRFFRGKLRKLRKSFFYENGLIMPQIVDQLGSGVAIAKGRYVPPFEFMDGSQNFVDVRWARWCSDNSIARVCLPRQKGWLTTQETNESIYENFTRRTPDNVLKEIYTFAGRWNLDELPFAAP
jgi:hypothetical protein